MKLLLICYECSPYIGSEWAVGWGRLLGAAKIAETHVLTSEANYKRFEQARAENLIPESVHLHTPDPDAQLRALEKKPALFAYNYRAYHHWQRLAWHYMQALHAQEHFDVVHQVNVCTFREPGFGYELGIPFIWGPVGGSQNFPRRFLPMLPIKEALKEGIRGIVNEWTLWKPRVRRAARQAALVIAANSTNQRDFERAFARKVELLLETGLHPFGEPNRARFLNRIEAQKEQDSQPPLRLLWSGELHTRKAFPVLLHALKRLRKDIAWELDVLGDGPMFSAWSAEVEKLGLSSRVNLLGRQSFTDAVAEMHRADLFCFTSLRDTSGNVVLEALAAGVPVLCFDHQGAGDMVTEACGIKIPVTCPARAYAEWADALEALISDPHRLLQLSHGATARAREFLWEQNHDRINALYESLAVGRPVPSATQQPEPVSAPLYESVEVQPS